MGAAWGWAEVCPFSPRSEAPPNNASRLRWVWWGLWPSACQTQRGALSAHGQAYARTQGMHLLTHLTDGKPGVWGGSRCHGQALCLATDSEQV